MLTARKKRIMIFLLLAAAILISPSGYAERVLSASLKICINDSVQVNYMMLEDANPSLYSSSGDYQIVIESLNSIPVYNESFEMNFQLLSNPPEPVNCSLKNTRIPYDPQMRHISIYKNTNMILSKDLNLCNNNGVCDLGYETHLSCTQDCPLNKEDKICLGQKDGICDPDCSEGIDPDCKNGKLLENESLNGENDYLPYLALAGLIIIVFVSILVYKGRQDKKIEQEREDFLKWKEEQERLKDAGKPPV